MAELRLPTKDEALAIAGANYAPCTFSVWATWTSTPGTDGSKYWYTVDYLGGAHEQLNDNYPNAMLCVKQASSSRAGLLTSGRLLRQLGGEMALSRRHSSLSGRLRRHRVPLLPVVLAAAVAGSCDQVLDAGRNETQGPLGLGVHNPVILINDSATDNWSPEYLALFANDGGPQIAGIVVNGSHYWPDLDANLSGWQSFVAAARGGGLRGIPDPVRSESPPLVVPPDRQIGSTKANTSGGAELIVRKSNELSLPGQPLVILCGAQLTDVASAYLIDPTVADRVVVVAQLGAYSSSKGVMSGPNGDLDPWADWIVSQYFSYVQISVYYDQAGDVTTDDLAPLLKNRFGAWMSDKRANLSNLQTASDQETILAVATPSFVTSFVRSAADVSGEFNVPSGQGPPLVADDAGNALLVTGIDAAVARAEMSRMLTNPSTFRP